VKGLKHSEKMKGEMMLSVARFAIRIAVTPRPLEPFFPSRIAEFKEAINENENQKNGNLYF